MYKEKIVNIATGKETWRDYTEVEIAEVEAAQAEEAQKQAEAETRDAARLAVLAKLGLTIEEANLLLNQQN